VENGRHSEAGSGSYAALDVSFNIHASFEMFT
jgi:hypothetical protein